MYEGKGDLEMSQACWWIYNATPHSLAIKLAARKRTTLVLPLVQAAL